MTLKDILISGKLTISEGGGGGGAELDALIDRSLESVTTQATTIGLFAFRNCGALKSVSAPNATELAESAFENCYLIETISLPEVTKIGSVCLSRVGQQAASKPIVVLPKLTTMLGRGNFKFGTFAAVDIGPNCSAIMSDCFYSNLNPSIGQVSPILILRRTAGIVTAGNGDSINGLQDVYVPSALISSYQTANNWKTRYDAGQIVFHAIEGSIYENAYADGTPIA